MARFSSSDLESQYKRGELPADPAAPEAEPLREGFWDNAVRVAPYGQASVPMPIDKDILDWFQTHGSGHLAQVNAVLRAYVEEQKRTA